MSKALMQWLGRAARVQVCVAAAFCAATGAHAADLKGDPKLAAPPPAASGWSFQMTMYGWVAWISGDVGIGQRRFDVDLNPSQLIDALDWGSGLPIWMSYAEARNGRLGLFNDIVYSKLANSADFARGRDGVLLNSGANASVEAENTQFIMELGSTYEVWNQRGGDGRTTALDVVGGVRYWRQEVSVTADASAWVGGPGGLVIEGSRATARSGSVDWWDPFVGLRVRHAVAPGQSLTVRGDIGGFGVGSEFSWHAIATYDARLFTRTGYTIDGYFGYKALSVDYVQGSGASRYEYNAIQQGPVLGLSVKF